MISDNNSILIFWIVGWVILSIGYYIYKLYIDKTTIPNKRLFIWKSFKYGIFSWIGIIFIFSYMITFYLYNINDWIENKLK